MITIKSIGPITASEWLDNKEAILIDVREPAEYEAVHIDGAHLIPVNSVSFNKLPPDIKNKKILHAQFNAPVPEVIICCS